MIEKERIIKLPVSGKEIKIRRINTGENLDLEEQSSKLTVKASLALIVKVNTGMEAQEFYALDTLDAKKLVDDIIEVNATEPKNDTSPPSEAASAETKE